MADQVITETRKTQVIQLKRTDKNATTKAEQLAAGEPLVDLAGKQLLVGTGSDNPKYFVVGAGKLVATDTADSTSVEEAEKDPYLNLVLDTKILSSTQLVGDGAINISSDPVGENGKLIIKNSYTASTSTSDTTSTSTKYISSISQDTTGKISATHKVITGSNGITVSSASGDLIIKDFDKTVNSKTKDTSDTTGCYISAVTQGANGRIDVKYKDFIGTAPIDIEVKDGNCSVSHSDSGATAKSSYSKITASTNTITIQLPKYNKKGHITGSANQEIELTKDAIKAVDGLIINDVTPNTAEPTSLPTGELYIIYKD